MVEVKIFQDGELKGEFKGDFAVCIVSSRTDRKDVLCNKVSYAGNPTLKELRAALANMEKACEVMDEFSADAMAAGAKAILDVYGDEED